MIFYIDTKSTALKAGFQHKVEAESVEDALAACVKNLAFNIGPAATVITIWHDGKIVGEWQIAKHSF